jgi:ferredoxin-NADP reductase
VAESSEITSFTLVPVDGGAVLAHQPGQYLGLRLTVDGQEVRRNYSLSQMANGRSLRISVKRSRAEWSPTTCMMRCMWAMWWMCSRPPASSCCNPARTRWR